MAKSQKNLHYCRREDWIACSSKGFLNIADGLRLDLESGRSAFLILPVIDSGEFGFRWKRLVLKGRFPDDSAVSIYAYSWDGDGEIKLSDIADMKAADEEIRKSLYEIMGPPVARAVDSILTLTGQKLILAIELSAGGREAPELSELILTIDSDHMTDYLPAVYRKDDFTRRFISVFNSMFLDLESRIENLAEIFDVYSDRKEVVKMLAAWLAISGNSFDEEQLKERIRTAFFDHEEKFTKIGIEKNIKRLTGKDSLIIEHFEVNPHSGNCVDSKLYERLYGDDPFTFFVLLPEDTFKSREEKENFIKNMNYLIPAGRRMELVILKQGIQLDWHSYLGVNSMVGDYTTVKIDENIALQFDTVIGGDGNDV